MKFGKFGTIDAGRKIADQQGTYRPLSQVIGDQINRTYRLIFPVLKLTGEFDEQGNWHESPIMLPDDKFETLASNVAGYITDFDVMGYSMIPCKEAYQDENGKLVDPTGLGSLVPIADILFDAAYKRDCEKKEVELRNEAEKMETELNPATLNEALKKIDIEYHGTRVNDTLVPPTKNPIIKRMSVNNYTAGKMYRIASDGKGVDLDFGVRNFMLLSSNKKALQLEMAISKALAERANKLSAIAVKKASGQPLTEDEENYKSTLDMGFIEVEYAYNGENKKQAGQNANFIPCGEASDSVVVKFPKFWAEHRKNFTTDLIRDDKIIDSKNKAFVHAPTVQQARAAFNKYCAEQAVLGSYVDFTNDSDRIKRSAQSMLDIAGFKQNPKFYEKLKELSDATKDVNLAVEEVDDHDKRVGDVLKAREDAGRALTLEETLKAAGGDIDSIAGELPEEL